jgi:hypothetical protein
MTRMESNVGVLLNERKEIVIYQKGKKINCPANNPVNYATKSATICRLFPLFRSTRGQGTRPSCLHRAVVSVFRPPIARHLHKPGSDSRRPTSSQSTDGHTSTRTHEGELHKFIDLAVVPPADQIAVDGPALRTSTGLTIHQADLLCPSSRRFVLVLLYPVNPS